MEIMAFTLLFWLAYPLIGFLIYGILDYVFYYGERKQEAEWAAGRAQREEEAKKKLEDDIASGRLNPLYFAVF